jgi:hypothetical protein
LSSRGCAFSVKFDLSVSNYEGANFMKCMSLVPWLCGLALVGVIVGCGSEPAANQPAETKTAADKAAANADEEAMIAEALATLSPEDRALAVAQQTCPVSGERIGAMPAPIVVEVKGRKVVLCCESCKESIMERPDEYLAKLAPLTEAPGKDK